MIKNFAERLSNTRRFGNLTVTDLAAWFGVKRPSVHKWMRGAQPREGKEEMLGSLLEDLENLFPKGHLPISLEVARNEHLNVIKALRTSYARNTKQNPTPKRNQSLVRG